MSYYTDFGLSDLYNWALLTLISACILILVAAVTLIWSLLRAKKVWWFSGLSLLLLGVGCWSLIVALNGFQQLAVFGTLLLRPHSITPAVVRFVLGMAYGSDIQRCQIQFGIVASAFVLIAMIILRQPLRRFAPKGIRVFEETGESTSIL